MASQLADTAMRPEALWDFVVLKLAICKYFGSASKSHSVR